jgi:hypothetical protein
MQGDAAELRLPLGIADCDHGESEKVLRQLEFLEHGSGQVFELRFGVRVRSASVLDDGPRRSVNPTSPVGVVGDQSLGG